MYRMLQRGVISFVQLWTDISDTIPTVKDQTEATAEVASIRYTTSIVSVSTDRSLLHSVWQSLGPKARYVKLFQRGFTVYQLARRDANMTYSGILLLINVYPFSHSAIQLTSFVCLRLRHAIKY